jgi:hypothetical protein
MDNQQGDGEKKVAIVASAPSASAEKTVVTVQSSTAPFSFLITASHSLNFVNYQAEKAEKINYGSAKQNGFSFLKKVTITNNTGSDIREATLEINFLPSCITCDPINLTCLEAGKTTEIDSFHIIVDPKYLYEISEAIEGSFSLILKDKSGAIIGTASQDIKILSIEESASEDRVPEVLASFVTPNDDLVKELAGKAALILNQKYHRSAFAGYQYRDVNKVVEELDALYLALQAEGIHYSNPPASFDKTFQRIRLPRTVLAEKTATCIDFSLLFASLAENVGINPLVIVINGHAFNGFWLEEETFQNGLCDNSTPILNRASRGISKILLVNSVDAAASSGINFQQAYENGYHELEEADPFLYALDITKCRDELIRPVPTPHNIDGKTTIEYDVAESEDYTPDKIDISERGIIEKQGNSAKSKFDLWEEKLLDLNTKNRLINLHLGGSVVQILNTDTPKLLAAIEQQDRLFLVPENTEGVKNRDFMAFDFAKSAFGNNFESLLGAGGLMALSANGYPDKALISLSRKANTEIEESGCNPLFLTIGAIKWFDTEKAASVGTGSLYSPILLIPVAISRRRVGDYFILEPDADNIQFNTTVFEYFKQFMDLDFSEFNNLIAQSEGNIDIQRIYNTIRSKISAKKGWAVIDNLSCLSMFSFAHFVMWSDMKNYRPIFLQNPIISSIVHGKEEWKKPEKEVEPKELDQSLSSTDLATPLSADSSQIAAIVASERGESFVLDGPPGTGKSQTIANMIVNAMFHGQTVLFVAEKEVALEVVKSRLDKMGLGSFCLQIHSAKANKKDVLDQLGKALEIGKTLSPKDYAAEAKKLDEERNTLNTTLRSLHTAQGYFVTIYDAIVGYLENRDYRDRFLVPEAYAKQVTSASFEAALQSIKELMAFGDRVGGYHKNPFLAFRSLSYDIGKRDELFLQIPAIAEKVEKLSAAFTNLLSKDFPTALSSRANAEAFHEAFVFARGNRNLNWAFLASEEYYQKDSAIKDYLSLCLDLATERENIDKIFKKDRQGLPQGSILVKEYEATNTRHFFGRLQGKLALRKKLLPFACSSKSLTLKNLQQAIVLLFKQENDQVRLGQADPFLSFAYPEEEKKTLNEINRDKAIAEATHKLASLVRSIVCQDNGTQKILDDFARFGLNPAELFDLKISSFLSSYEDLIASNASLKKSADFDLLAYEEQDHYFAAAEDSLQQTLEEKGMLGEWTAFLNSLEKAKRTFPDSFLLAYENGLLASNEAIPAFKAALYYRIICLGLAEEKLTNLTALSTDQVIAQYQDDLNKFRDLTIRETAARVTASFPSVTVAYAGSTKIAQLRHLCANGGRGKSLRVIFDEFGEIIHLLCPCFLMSPLSVAQYLKPGQHLFDDVVFDEASQIQTAEAIGAIARGKAAVIAGDQQQMPPTNFFAASLGSTDDESEDDDEVAYDDLESLLDDAIALHLPRLSLNWHYRSNDESLIAFSNNRFYQNKLFTFPSPSNQKSKVSFRYIGGRYEKGKGINKDEANAIVQEVMKRLKSPEGQTKSIGIITFNEKQQNLIDDMLQKEFSNNPTLNQNPGGESIFVKNLENVQGDERDLILFSVCFGPDPKTHVMVLNFGPLSREKGERRLNVAVSRARDEMIVFASTQPEDIRADQAKNEGPNT